VAGGKARVKENFFVWRVDTPLAVRYTLNMTTRTTEGSMKLTDEDGIDGPAEKPRAQAMEKDVARYVYLQRRAYRSLVGAQPKQCATKDVARYVSLQRRAYRSLKNDKE
jgi:hypothetical protein